MSRLTKEELMEFITFTFRPDISVQLEKVKSPHILAVKLYKEETGKDINVKTAYNQRNKWIMINGKIEKIKNNK